MSSSEEQSRCSRIVYPYNGKILLAAVVSLSVVISFVFLLHVYVRWLLRRRPVVARSVRAALHHRSLTPFPGHATETRSRASGLDARVVASLPVFVYRHEGIGAALDCVVCLSAMEEDEKGRVLPGCKHAFHVGCIDMWLMSHSTCPICRAAVCLEDPSSLVADASLASDSVTAGEGVAQDEVRRPDEEMIVESEASVAVSSSIASTSSSSSSLGCSLKRMLSNSRSESRVFPSVIVN